MTDFGYAANLRAELAARNRAWAAGKAHAESYGADPVVVYEPEGDTHGNFFAPAWQAIQGRPEWAKRLDKVHTLGRKSLPLPTIDHKRKWRELDSSTSSDALLMNCFCTPGVAESPLVLRLLGVGTVPPPEFGWRARVPLTTGRLDRTEVDMRWGDLLVEAKLTESDFQRCREEVLTRYRDFDAVFDPDLLPRVAIPVARRRASAEFPEDYTQDVVYVAPEEWEPTLIEVERPSVTGFASYQLVRNVLAAVAAEASFCVLLDARRPDLLEAWFSVMAAVRDAAVRTRLKVLTWQELAGVLPADLQEFLEAKYGIVAA